MKRILICTLYSGNTTSGASKNAFNFASYLVKHYLDFKIQVLTIDLNKGFLKKEKNLNVNYIRIRLFLKNIVGKIFSFFFIFPLYCLFTLKNSIIIIYGKGFWGYEIIIFFGKIFNKKIIFRSTTIGIDDLSSIISHKIKILGHIRFILLKSIYLYYAINPIFRISWEKFIKNTKIIVQPQGVCIKKFCPPKKNEIAIIRKTLKLSSKKIIFLSVGHVITRKGFEEIFSVLSHLTFDFLYVVVGNTNKDYESNTLINIGKQLLQDKIYFTGVVNNIEEYYKAADIFIHNALQEGTPNVLLEAMASGLPCCIRNLPGITNYITYDKFNSLVHNNTYELFSNIELLINQPRLYQKISINSRKWILNNCSFRLVSKKIFEYIY